MQPYVSQGLHQCLDIEPQYLSVCYANPADIEAKTNIVVMDILAIKQQN